MPAAAHAPCPARPGLQVGNAYFSLAIHALPAGWRRVAVVTSDFHMPRTAALFRHMYSVAGRELLGDAAR